MPNTELPSILEEYLNCFNSYTTEWKVPFLSPRQMAAAGLTYTGMGDRVKCLYCSIELDTWEPNDDPHTEHLEKSPYCAFFRNSHDEHGYDECGIYKHTNPNQNIEGVKNLLHFFNIIGIVHNITVPEFGEYCIYEDRLRTFEKCLLKKKNDFHAYVKAGFFYIGRGYDDYMTCFSCNLCLSSWDDDDDPWEEHARWSPNCSFVLLNKGQAYIHEICGTESERVNIKQRDLSIMIDYHMDPTSNQDIMVLKSTTEKNIDDEKNMNIADLFAKTELQEAIKRQDPNAVQDMNLCKICYRNEIVVAFVPCCHVIACVDCALSMVQCAICRMGYASVIKIFISPEKVEDRELQDVARKPSDALNKPLSDKLLCKICRMDEIQVLFIPCRHVHSCIKCATELHECPVCSEVICASIHIFL